MSYKLIEDLQKKGCPNVAVSKAGRIFGARRQVLRTGIRAQAMPGCSLRLTNALAARGSNYRMRNTELGPGSRHQRSRLGCARPVG